MSVSHTADVVAHYTQRHTQRGDLYGAQPFANYGYWTRPDLSFEQAAEALTDLVAASAGLGPQDHVLDVGCGYGAGAVVFARRYGVQAVQGIDVTEIRIEAGRQYCATHGLAERIQLDLGDATRMSFADASFDKLVSVECAFHFDTRLDFLREAGRVLKPGGTLALTDMIPVRGVDPKAYMFGGAVTTGRSLDHPVNAYDADVYAQHLRDAGFSLVRIESILAWTRLPFVEACERRSAGLPTHEAAQAEVTTRRMRAKIAAGEDYVLVIARKAS